jgi:hypothetical protein
MRVAILYEIACPLLQMSLPVFHSVRALPRVCLAAAECRPFGVPCGRASKIDIVAIVLQDVQVLAVFII